MKTVAFAAGLAAGMAVADSKRMIKTGKRAIDRMCNW